MAKTSVSVTGNESELLAKAIQAAINMRDNGKQRYAQFKETGRTTPNQFMVDVKRVTYDVTYFTSKSDASSAKESNGPVYDLQTGNAVSEEAEDIPIEEIKQEEIKTEEQE